MPQVFLFVICLALSRLVSATNLVAEGSECELHSTIPEAGLGVFKAVERKIGETVGIQDAFLPLIDINLDLSATNLVAEGSECELYMAESTIPEAGLGVFTAVERKIGETVGIQDAFLPLIDVNLDLYRNAIEHYVWNGLRFGMGFETYRSQISAIWSGMGAAVNSNIPLINVRLAEKGGRDSCGIKRWNPGAGAISPYRSPTTHVVRDIPAGGELFLSYGGDSWFRHREAEFGKIPLSNDYAQAQALLQTMNQLSFSEQLYDLVLEMQAMWDSRTLNALPKTYQDAQRAIVDGITALHQANATRSKAWLQEHGTCADHISTGPSTIDGAGNGAFARRDLPKGTLITGSPLFHVPFDTLLYPFQDPRSQYVPGMITPNLTQVVLNYCFGHLESSVLLCPYGMGINYINHNQTCANVKIQWAEHGKSAHNSLWLHSTPRDMALNTNPNLGIDYIATKDIKMGEELFLDYGDTWDRAWQKHVKRWVPSKLPSVDEWNEWKGPIRTEDEKRIHPYPSNIDIRCDYRLKKADWEEQFGNEFVHESKLFQGTFGFPYGFPCTVLERDDTNNTYVVELYQDFLSESLAQETTNRRSGVPREALFFVSTAYYGELHHPKAFRHRMYLPDDMIPPAWKNRLNRSNNLS